MTIRNYTNTLLELRTCEERYRLLQERREVYYVKYLGVRSPNFEKIGSGKNWSIDGMSVFLDLVGRINPQTGMSLDEELEMLARQIAELNTVLKKIRAALRKMEGLEFQLYVAIVIDGLTVTEAVQKTAEKNYLSEQTVWRYHLPKIKEELDALRRKK